MRIGRIVKTMIRNEVDGIVFFTFNNLTQNGIKHLFSTRIGGVSKGKFASMNLSFSRDDAKSVSENFKRIAQLGFPLGKMVLSNQIHESKVKRVFDSDCGKGILIKSDIIGVDGLMTNEQGVVLVTFYADCVPLYFYDPEKKAIALSHAGWRGTLAEIGKGTIEQMEIEFGSNPSDILIGIGASICKDCFEVGSEVADAFMEKLSYSSDFIKQSQSNDDKFFIDVRGINKQALINAGVLERNIEISDICTKTNPDTFYSHRAMGIERGSMAAFLVMT